MKEIERSLDRALIVGTAKQLQARGVGSFHIDDMRANPVNMHQIVNEVMRLKEKPDEADRGSKSYIRRLINDDLSGLPSESEIRSFALNRTLFLIAASYLRLAPRLTSFKVWASSMSRTRATQGREASQIWHRDYSERRLVRCFLNINDVDSLNGATEYILGTHLTGSFNHVGQDLGDDGLSRYTDDARLPSSLLQDCVISASGPSGQVTLIDTGGIHRGGWHMDDRERLVALTTFVTPLDLYPGRLKL